MKKGKRNRVHATRYVITLKSKATPYELALLQLVGTIDSFAQEKFLADLTEIQYMRLRKQDWISSVEPDTYVKTCQ